MKNVVITGASRGIGLGIARWCVDRGYGVAACARSPIDVPSALCVSVDVTDVAAVDRFAAEAIGALGSIDLWINNAGIIEPIRFAHDLTSEDVRRVFDVNVLGVFHGSRAYARHVRAVGSGVLINVSSGAAQRAYAGWSAYCASKAAVDRFTEALQIEEEAHGLRAHAVAPGVVDTAMQSAIRSSDMADFPMRPRFEQLLADQAFFSEEHVARALVAMAFDPAHRPGAVVCRVSA